MTSVVGDGIDADGIAPGRWIASPHADARRVPSLDGLRALSILLVLCSHFVAADIFPGGLGVLIFFVISGFLITRLMFAEWNATGALKIGRFYWRRLWRLYPAVVGYSLAITACFLFAGRPVRLLEPLSALFYFTNYLWVWFDLSGARPVMPFQIFWSLSIEEHFYWLFPLLFAALRADARRLTLAMVGLCVLCLAARVILAVARPDLLSTHLVYWSELRIDSIGFGVLLAALCETARGRRLIERLERPEAFALGLAAVTLSLVWRNPWFRETVRYSLEAGGIAVMLCGVLFSRRYPVFHGILNAPLVVWTGVLSYSLYVWHPLVENLFGFYWPRIPHPLAAIAGLAGSFVLAAASYYLLEAPLRGRYAGLHSDQQAKR